MACSGTALAFYTFRRAVMKHIMCTYVCEKCKFALSIDSRSYLLEPLIELLSNDGHSPKEIRVFENRVVRRIFGPNKRDEVTGEWRKLHNEELHILYSSPNIIRQIKSRRMRWAGHVARMGEERNMYRVLMGKLEGKRSLGSPKRRWEDGIRMDLREIGWGSVDWIQLAQDRDRWRALVNTVMNLRVLTPRS
jgi:hypothetical protein